MNGLEILQIVSSATSIVTTLYNLLYFPQKIAREGLEKSKNDKARELFDKLSDNKIISNTELFKLKNRSKIAAIADKYLTDMPKRKINTSNCDIDLIFRTFEEAGYVSNEKMQDLWARLLAGEIKQPSKYSFWTIDTLRKMSQKDAMLFEEVCKHSLRNNFQGGDMPFVPFEEMRKHLHLRVCESFSVN